jgi:hypothetical protein
MDPELRSFLAIMARFDLTDIEVSALTGIAPGTARYVRIGRVLPTQARCRAAIRDFNERNRAAKQRSDLSLPDRRAPAA